ncbi:hypothetical protein VTH06DRAFT_6227 [Thermothelomyces fergusii]
MRRRYMYVHRCSSAVTAWREMILPPLNDVHRCSRPVNPETPLSLPLSSQHDLWGDLEPPRISLCNVRCPALNYQKHQGLAQVRPSLWRVLRLGIRPARPPRLADAELMVPPGSNYHPPQ